MFTGIVEGVGRVVAIEREGDDRARLRIDLGPLAEGCAPGDSVSVSGACLTVTAREAGVAAFDVSAETLRRTTLGGWSAGHAVNVERALPASGRFGGHIVAGHVDAVGRLAERAPEGGGERFVLELPEAVRTVEKGSLAVDGVSLTTFACRDGRCTVALVPHTLERTTLGRLAPGDPVNLEQDLVGRWVERLLADAGRI